MTTLADFTLPRPCRRTVAALAPVILGEEVRELALIDDVVDGVELFLRAVPTPVRVGLVAGIVTFEQSARAAPSSLGRGFSALPPAKAAAHFERWWKGPGHQLARGLKMAITFSYYEHPQVCERLGYDPERWIAKVKQERAERFAEEIAAVEAAVIAPDPLVPQAAPAKRAAKELPRAKA